MAQVDFTNAVLELVSTNTNTPTSQPYTNFYSILRDVNGNNISTAMGSIISSTKKGFVYSWSGTFSASGTEFYFYQYTDAKWKISNISFNSGDTYVFQIPVTLTCL